MDIPRSRRRSTPVVGALLTLMLVLGIAPGTVAVETQSDAAASAVDWLASQQLDDGAFPGFSGDADPSTTADAVIGIASTGIDPATLVTDTGANPVSYLQGQASATAGNPGAAGRLLMALHAAQGASLNPRDVNGVDLVAIITNGFDAEAGTYGQGIFSNSYAILGLRAVGEAVATGAVTTLVETQIEDGSWNFNGDTTPGAGDSNTTAIVAMALVAAGAAPAQIQAGLDYIASLQAADGTVAFDGSEDPLVGDANSTALAVQAYIAAGRDPGAMANGNAVAALTGFQQPSGALTWRTELPEDNMFATVQAIPALVGWALPVAHLGAQPAPIDGEDAVDIAMQPATGLGLEGCSYSIATFHNVCGPYAQYWEANGGLKIFGYPLTEPFIEDGVQVQYFERTRLEYHPGVWPENFDILQGRLGAEQLGLPAR